MHLFKNNNKQIMEKIDDDSNIRDKIKVPDNIINRKFVYSCSDIELAAEYCNNKENFTIFEYLLKKNRKNRKLIKKILKSKLRDGDTSCMQAIKLLMDYGADINCMYKNGRTPLMLVCDYDIQKPKKEFVEFLLKNGSKVNVVDKYGNDALLFICKKGKKEDIEIIKLLLEYGANVNSNKSNFSCLMCAAHNTNYDITKLLIENGANVNYVSKNGYGILNLIYDNTIHYNNEDNRIIKLLIENGANVNSKNKSGETPLMNIIMLTLLNKSLEYESIKLLLDNKADVYIKNINGKNIFNIVENVKQRNSDIYSFIFYYKNIYNDYLCERDINFIY